MTKKASMTPSLTWQDMYTLPNNSQLLLRVLISCGLLNCLDADILHLTAITWRKGTVQNARYQCSVVPWVHYTTCSSSMWPRGSWYQVVCPCTPLCTKRSSHSPDQISWHWRRSPCNCQIPWFISWRATDCLSAYGTKKHYRLIPALPFFHAFSGCDTLASFSSMGRKWLGTPGEFSLILHTHSRSYPRWQHQSQRSKSVKVQSYL